jgi:nucleotide-binding universal stress UspA family protein
MADNVSRVVVGVDGSAGSVGAARWAGAVANKFGTSVHLVHSSATTGHFIADAAVIAIRAAATADQR